MCVRATATSPVGLFIHKGGRWLRLDLSGRLQGERRRPRFFYLRRGQLKMLQTRRVLRQMAAARAGPPLHSTRRKTTSLDPEERQAGATASRPAEKQATETPASNAGPAPSERPAAGLPDGDSAPALRSPHGALRAQHTRAQLTQAHSKAQSTLTSNTHFAPLLLSAISPQTPITKRKPRQPSSLDSEAKSKSSRESSPILSKPNHSRTKRTLEKASKNPAKPTDGSLQLKSKNTSSKTKITRSSKNQAYDASSSSTDEPSKLPPRPNSSRLSTNEIVHIPSKNVLKRTRSVGDKRNDEKDASSSGDEFVSKPTSVTRQTRANLRRSTEDSLQLLGSLNLMPVSQLPQKKPDSSRKLRKRPAATTVKPFEISTDDETAKKTDSRQRTSQRNDTSSDEADVNETRKLRAKPRLEANSNSGKPGPLSTKTLSNKPNSSHRNNPTHESTKALRSGLNSAKKRLRVESSESSDWQVIESKILRSSQGQSRSGEGGKQAKLGLGRRKRQLSSDSLSMSSWDGGKPAYASSPRQSPCKELFMSVSDVEAVAGWLARVAPARSARLAVRPPYDAEKFRADEAYRTKVLFLIQPLVYCGRHRLITSSSKAGQRLRIRSDRTASPGTESETEEGSDKENRAGDRDSRRREREAKRERDGESERDGKRGPGPKSERDGKVAAGDGGKGRGSGVSRPPHFPPPHPRAFSALEDRAIVDYIQNEGLALEVNGNSLWKRLETEFQTLCGQPRTWQSLRNRYLRYLLPSLHRLALTPRQAQRLRAAAATGSLKLSRKRRNSLLAPPAPAPVPASAWSRRPRPQLDTTPVELPAADPIPRTGRRGLLPMSYL